jgi:hypothetical protein
LELSLEELGVGLAVGTRFDELVGMLLSLV